MSNSWPMVPLGEVLKPVSRPEPVDPMKKYRLLGVRLDGAGPFLRQTVVGSQSAASTLFQVKEGDFIYSRLFASRAAFGVIGADLNSCYVSGEFPTFRPIAERIDVRFLSLWFRIPSTIDKVESHCSGSTPLTRNRFKENFFLALEISLPPLSEQRRIVARIDELAAKIEEAKGLRQQTAEEREALYASTATELFEALAVSPRFSIEKLTEVRGGIQKGPHRIPGDNAVRYLTVAHVHRNHISLSDPRFFEVTPAELEIWRLQPGDVLIIEGNGSPDQIGRTALFRGEIENCVHQNHVIRIRPDQSRLDPEFLNTYVNSPPGQEEVQSRSRTTSGLRNLSVGRIKQITVPVPSRSEQRRVVDDLNHLRAKLDYLKQMQAATAAQLDAMLPSILDKAFRGEL